MKAEHRKELETNALADRMGRMLENVKQKPKRGTALFIVAAVVVIVVTFMGVRWYRYGRVEDSEAWYYSYYFFDVFQSAHHQKNREGVAELSKLVKDSHSEKIQGRFVRFQENWSLVWDRGILMVGLDPRGAKANLQRAAAEYKALQEECEGDPVLVPEAIYGQAVIEETLALEDRKHLENAIELYEEVHKKHPKSAYGQLAEKRLAILNDETKRREVNEIYQDLQNVIRFDRRDPMDLFPHLKK
jgi:tetratricopeptide (TPR) repeat protein